MSHTPFIQRQNTLTFGVMYSQWVVWWVIAQISRDDLLHAKAFIFISFIVLLLDQWFPTSGSGPSKLINKPITAA